MELAISAMSVGGGHRLSSVAGLEPATLSSSHLSYTDYEVCDTSKRIETQEVVTSKAAIGVEPTKKVKPRFIPGEWQNPSFEPSAAE